MKSDISSAANNLIAGTFTKYLLLAFNIATGMFLMPFTVHHLGQAEYGLWMLVASMTYYFQLLDMGYGNGIVRHIVGFTIYGDYRRPHPASEIMDAVVDRRVDIAVVWGPLAGYFARSSAVPLDVVPVSPQMDPSHLPFVFDIAMGVRRRDKAFHAQIDSIIARRKPAIDSVLASYGVPRVDVRQAGGS